MVLVIILLVVAFGVLGAVLAAAETAVMLLPAGRVHRLVEAEGAGSHALEALAQRPHRLRATSALVAALTFGLCVALGISVGAVIQIAGLVLLSEAVYALLAILLVFALGQSLPRTLAVANSERIGLESAAVAQAAISILYPIARLLGAPWRWAVRLTTDEQQPSPWVTGAEYRVTDNDEDAEREEAEEALLEAVSDFAEKIVREVMVPRTDMKALPDTALVADAVKLIDQTGFSRLPVYHDSTDDICGVLYAKDLLVALSAGRAEGPIGPMAREPYFVPETKQVEELLVEMRTKTHIAIVADEYGGTAGLITLEDLLEEIIGEISDEYDREEPLITALDGGRFSVDARLPVDDLNEVFGTDIDIDADSVGGLFTEVAGRIPEVGESVSVDGLKLTVDELQGNRICRLTVEPVVVEANEGDQHA
ncbi:MAG: hemolysin family protein [Coriobacteriia bacterium]